jgi:hypothetical protein
MIASRRDPMPPVKDPEQVQSPDRERFLAEVRSWMEDESGYDERVWPIVKKAIEENKLSPRNRFAE